MVVALEQDTLSQRPGADLEGRQVEEVHHGVGDLVAKGAAGECQRRLAAVRVKSPRSSSRRYRGDVSAGTAGGPGVATRTLQIGAYQNSIIQLQYSQGSTYMFLLWVIVFLTARAFEPTYPWLGFVKAFAEAARGIAPNLIVHGLEDQMLIELAKTAGLTHASVRPDLRLEEKIDAA